MSISYSNEIDPKEEDEAVQQIDKDKEESRYLGADTLPNTQQISQPKDSSFRIEYKKSVNERTAVDEKVVSFQVNEKNKKGFAQRIKRETAIDRQDSIK